MADLNLDLHFFQHPKTVRLVGRLGKGAEVLLIRLWCHCGVHHCEEGKLSGYSPSEIETAVGWWGKPGVMVAEMLGLRWLEQDEDGYYRVHDWVEHQGHISAMKAKGKAMAKARWGKIHAYSNADSITESPPAALPCTDYSDKAINRLGNRAVSQNGEKSKLRNRRDVSDLENEFMQDCMVILGKSEIAQNGGLWRTLFAQNAGKARRVIDEVRATLRDRPTEIKTNPAAFAMDLWKRFA